MTAVIAGYSIVVGVLMGVWWAIEIRSGALSRPDRSRAEISLHVSAELLTAALLVVGGVILFVSGVHDLVFVGLGMLLYTVLASPGYFLARRQTAPVAMFAGLAVLTIAVLVGALVTES